MNKPGYPSLIPALVFKDAKKAIEFYKKAFGAKETELIAGKDGRVMHAELEVGGSRFMLGEEMAEHQSAETLGAPNCFSLNLYVADADATFKTAVAAGAKPGQAPQEMFWGDRYGRIVDPFGYTWGLLTHVKDVSPEEMKKAAREWADKPRAAAER